MDQANEKKAEAINALGEGKCNRREMVIDGAGKALVQQSGGCENENSCHLRRHKPFGTTDLCLYSIFLLSPSVN